MNKNRLSLTAGLLISTLFLLGGCATLLVELGENAIRRTPAEKAKPEKEPTSEIATQPPAQKSELAAAEQEIYRLVNEHRAQQNLPELRLNTELSQVARDHSIDMGQHNFYGHKDPQGITPQQRINREMGDRYYLDGTAENIAYSERSDGFSALSQQQIAGNFMRGWMNSPGHRENILRPAMTHIGIGLQQQGNRIYATQNFISYIARLTSPEHEATLTQDQAEIRFVLNPLRVDPEDLTVLVRLPDKNTKWPTANGSYYRGLGYVEPRWTGEHEFRVELPVSTYGKGTYAIQLGGQGDRSVNQKQFIFCVN